MPYLGSVRGFQMVPLVILPLVANGTIERASGTIDITIGTNRFTNDTIGRTLDDIACVHGSTSGTMVYQYRSRFYQWYQW